MRVKVCGMTEIDQIRQLDAMGVDFAGFIFYPKSPRYVLRHLAGEQVKKARFRLGKVGVFVNATYDDVMRQVDSFGLDMIQLHGDETPRFCEQAYQDRDANTNHPCPQCPVHAFGHLLRIGGERNIT